ncbi:DNA polymerase III subunit gamma/tau [candidate division WWE3 bacterium]|uniref:DNA polymerase III subunit gamma/tau n=1 Tax=candidate division WWE3 bacterium TaxID=2053526 RepID=A0A3A4ZG09_UNCKA|nr:MAG: DNA polymerase III subunit gamma/tau [candidate division WWE3 bacterium]
MFYTKYRPQKFSEISRPNEAADALSKQVVTGKAVHAYLFVGPRGTGKTSTARILSKALNCPDLDKNGDPCDKCSTCDDIRKGSFLDLIEIDAASNRGIDDIRDLKNKVRLAPTSGKNKIYIIDEVHMLTNEAFNALLKTLEEPPKHTTFILCTTELHKVPETIKSRCQVFKFKRATIKQLVTKLEYISKQEKIKISTEDLERIARASLGGFRDAETLLQQVSEGEIKIDSLLNNSSWDSYIEFVDYLTQGDVSKAIANVNKAYEDGIDLYVWCGDLLKYFRDLMLLKSGVPDDFLEVPTDILESLKKQVVHLETADLLLIIENFADAHSLIKNNTIPQLPIEIAIIKVCGRQGGSYKKQTIIPPEPVSGPKPKKEKTSISNEQSNDTQESELTNSDESHLDAAVDVAAVKEKWTVVIEKMNDLNRSLLALLKASNPVKVEGRTLVLEVFYAFHKERLESPKNRKMVEDVIRDIVSADINIKCILSNEKPKKLKGNEVGVLTDINVVMPATQKIVEKEAVLGMLDGELPF